MLFSTLPVSFAADPAKIDILRTPEQFHAELLSLASTAKSRVHLAALYMGSDGKESQLLEALEDNVISSPSLQVQCLFDHSRGCRGDIPSAIHMHRLLRASSASSSQSSNPRVQAHFFKVPALDKRPYRAFPPRFRETIGVQHIKGYVFDDTVIISGANLSNDYFTDRQDRYWVFRDAPALADWMASLLSGVGRHSVPLQARGGTDALADVAALKAAQSPLSTPAGMQSFKSMMHAHMHASNEEQPSSEQQEACTRVYPSLQFLPAGITQDSERTKHTMATDVNGAHLYISTGYFNLTPEYRAALLQRAGPVSVLTAAPAANGFTGANGPAGAIPQAYTEFLRMFLKQCAAHGASGRITALEYARPAWTFHSKGMWLHAQPGTRNASTGEVPVSGKHQSPLADVQAWTASGSAAAVSYVGSPNYGLRSVTRDIELQMGVATRNKALMQRMQEEREHLFSAPGVQQATVESLSDPSRCIQPRWAWANGAWIHAGWRLLGAYF